MHGNLAKGWKPIRNRKTKYKILLAAEVSNSSNEVLSSVDLAINSLKGNITVGQKYESGFTLPHEELYIGNGSHLNVLVLITIAPDHEKYRTAIR